MHIISINWIDKSAQEAEVLVSDNQFELLCFSHPFTKSIDIEIHEPIYCLDVNNIVLALEQVPHAEKKSDAYGYHFRSRLVSKKNKIVHLGNIKLCLEGSYIPGDIDEGEYIEFEVSRLDL